MPFLRRTLIPTLGQTLISESEMGISKRCWQLKMSDGCELECFLQYDFNLGAVLKLVIRGSHCEDVRASELVDALSELLVERGAVEMSEEGVM